MKVALGPEGVLEFSDPRVEHAEAERRLHRPAVVGEAAQILCAPDRHADRALPGEVRFDQGDEGLPGLAIPAAADVEAYCGPVVDEGGRATGVDVDAEGADGDGVARAWDSRLAYVAPDAVGFVERPQCGMTHVAAPNVEVLSEGQVRPSTRLILEGVARIHGAEERAHRRRPVRMLEDDGQRIIVDIWLVGVEGDREWLLPSRRDSLQSHDVHVPGIGVHSSAQERQEIIRQIRLERDWIHRTPLCSRNAALRQGFKQVSCRTGRGRSARHLEVAIWLRRGFEGLTGIHWFRIRRPGLSGDWGTDRKRNQQGPEDE